MKPNTPNTEFEKKIFAKLPNFSIVGNTVSQNYEMDQIVASTKRQAAVEEQKAQEQAITTTPSLIKGDKGDTGARGPKGERGEKGDSGKSAELPKPPNNGVWILGSVNGDLKWLETEDCAGT